MKSVKLIIILLSFCGVITAEYRINLFWDEFGGECNGFINGTIADDFAFVSGGGSDEVLNGRLISVGEGMTWEAQQVFLINSEEGYFNFWIKDKFADEDFATDPMSIARAKPTVKIYRNSSLIKQINIPEGKGLTCRVFGLDAASGEIEEYSSYYPANRIFLGRVVNALDGEPLADVTITATDYLGMSDAILTEPDGGFIFPVEIGEYKLEFSKDGFIGSSFQIRMGADETPREIRCALSPQVQEYRIVLTWQQNPRDLDAHLSGPHPEGGDFHIWYRNKVLIDGRDFLDRDDLDGYGPETITIYKPASGTYRYAVHDYTNKSKTSGSSLSNSGALVQIYGANRLLGSFTVPPGQPGNCWYVFEIDSQHKIKPTNFIDYIAEERNIW